MVTAPQPCALPTGCARFDRSPECHDQIWAYRCRWKVWNVSHRPSPNRHCSAEPRSYELMGAEHVRTDRRSEEHTSELQSRGHLVCRLLLEKKKGCEERQFAYANDHDSSPNT